MKKELSYKRLTRLILLLFCIFAFLLLCAFSCEKTKKFEMRTSAYWTSPTMTADQAAALAQHDIVIVDMENMINNKESLLIMKKLNADIKLLCYSNPMEIWDPMPANRPLQTTWANEIKIKYPQWLLKTGSGVNCIFWSGMLMLNMSEVCPLANTEFGALRYDQWMARKLVAQVLSDPIWDGHFTDNCTQDVSWVRKGQEQIDIDGDGDSDIPSYIDRSWEAGMRKFLNNLRANTRPNFLLFGNKGILNYADILDGVMFENFPNDYLGSTINGGWDQCISNAEMMRMGNVRYVIFQAQMQNFNFALASTLLFDHAYVALGQDNTSFPEILKLNPGKPSGERNYTGNGLWFRDFENISVEVYPPGAKAEIRPIEKGLDGPVL